jgi:lipopolysaccharide export system protein LptA
VLGVNRILLSLFLVVSQSAVALKSDRDQTVKVHADEVEMDFSSGTRIYQGNVSVHQGTIRIIADRIELIYDGEQLETGIATGDRAVFRQRPDNKDHDMVGLGQRIELDEINNIVTFIGEAELRQGGDAIKGDRIIYDMARDRMRVLGDTESSREGEDSEEALQKEDNDRPKITIQPDEPGATNSEPSNSSSALVPEPSGSSKAYVGKTGAPVFATQSVTGVSLGTLTAASPVRVLRSKDGWAEINAPRGVRVWIHGDYVSANSGPATVTGSNVNLRSSPSTDTPSVVLGKISKGQRVLVLSVKNDWKEIEAPADLKVWILSAHIQPAKDLERWQNDWRRSLGAAADG